MSQRVELSFNFCNCGVFSRASYNLINTVLNTNNPKLYFSFIKLKYRKVEQNNLRLPEAETHFTSVLVACLGRIHATHHRFPAQMTINNNLSDENKLEKLRLTLNEKLFS